MSHDEKDMKTAEIRVNRSNNDRTYIGRVVVAAIAVIAIALIFGLKVSYNASKAQPTDPASANKTLAPGQVGTCDQVGQTVGCLQQAPPPALVNPDTDGDGIVDSVDQCDNAREDIDGVEDTDGCPEVTDRERIVILEKEMKGQRGQWDAIAALKEQDVAIKKRLTALENWQVTVNNSLKVGQQLGTKQAQINRTFVFGGQKISKEQAKLILEKMAQN